MFSLVFLHTIVLDNKKLLLLFVAVPEILGSRKAYFGPVFAKRSAKSDAVLVASAAKSPKQMRLSADL